MKNAELAPLPWRKMTRQWFEECEPELWLIVRNRLGASSSLRRYVDEIAGTAISRASALASHPAQCHGYFTTRRQCLLWLREVVYRESLKNAVLIAPVEKALRSCDESSRRLLLWSYCDHFTLLEIAKVAELRKSRLLTPDMQLVRMSLLNAHSRLCELLRAQENTASTSISKAQSFLFDEVFPKPLALTESTTLVGATP